MSQVVNGTTYHDNTPSRVIKELEDARIRKRKILFRLGYKSTGKDWIEENDICGWVGRSTGHLKVPLLLPRRNSTGGVAILDDNILRLIVDGNQVYRHQDYVEPVIEVKKIETGDDLPFHAFVDGNDWARFHTELAANRWRDYILCKRMGR